jgi:hypothetical protein
MDNGIEQPYPFGLARNSDALLAIAVAVIPCGILLGQPDSAVLQ